MWDRDLHDEYLVSISTVRSLPLTRRASVHQYPSRQIPLHPRIYKARRFGVARLVCKERLG